MLSDDEFGSLLSFFNMSREGYRRVRKGVKKRLRKRIQRLQIKDFDDYMSLIAEDGEEREHCRILMTVSISRFFRDPDLWTALEYGILPELFKRTAVRIWSAGCGCGQEAYSIKIMCDRVVKRSNAAVDLNILATDMNADYLDKARRGVFTSSSLKNVPEMIQSLYFGKIKGTRQYLISENLRNGIDWRLHDLLTDEPPGVFDIIFMRNNILTYCNQDLIEKTMRKISGSLGAGGYLITGKNEKIPAAFSEYRDYQGVPFIKVIFGVAEYDRPKV